MKFLITTPRGSVFNKYFPPHIMEQLEEMGKIALNPYERNFTQQELADALHDVDVVITHWGAPQITAEVLNQAPRLKLMAHGTGTVARIASEAFYERGIPVISANSIMAEYVAEAVIGYMIAGSHKMLQLDQITRADRWDLKHSTCQRSLLGSTIGLVGLGTIARLVLDMLAPFRCKVYVYDPYAKQEDLQRWPFAEFRELETVMSQSMVSLHAGKTPETYHMIDAKALALIPDNGILINSARGALVDTDALIAELKTERIYAVLDVYEREGTGGVPQELLQLTKNTLLQPHMACAPVSWEMTQGIVDDIRRFLNNQPLQLQIGLQQYRLMTQE